MTSPSTWHHSEESWAGRVEKHETSPIFSKRPLTTGSVNLLHDVLGFSYREAFFVLQFLLMAMALMCFYHWLSVVGFGRREALTGMIVFGLSHSVFLAHFEPVFIWSDFWVYALVPLSLAASLKRSHTIAIGTMALALIARETSVLFVPLMVWALRLGGSRYWRALLSAAAVITLFIAERLYLQPELSAAPDFKLAFNFANPLRTSDTIYSFIVS
ncbi:hypothetical protein GF356_05145, partial [candidate division GN15 bacterium]|nr:hypothetical protein [candidate division GN15 bacterium]